MPDNGKDQGTPLFELYKQSKVNRFHFLEQKKTEFFSCTSDHKRKKLIAELIQLEPTHLAEDWILDQVIKMLKDRPNNLEYIEEAFRAKGKRNELTKGQRDNLAKTSFLSHKIDKDAQKKRISKTKARRLWVADLPESEDNNLSEQPVEALTARLKRYRKALDKRALPFPYYGLDFLEVDEGTENHHLEFYTFNKPITLGDSSAFGNAVYSIPLKNKTKMFIPLTPATE